MGVGGAAAISFTVAGMSSRQTLPLISRMSVILAIEESVPKLYSADPFLKLFPPGGHQGGPSWAGM